MRPFIPVSYLSGKSDSYLIEVDIQAKTMFFQLVEQQAKQEGITEQFKAESQIKWVRQMNSVRNWVEEVVNARLIFV